MVTKIFLNTSGTIEMYDDIAISCTYSIADIKNPESRNANYSKTISIPGTKNNNRLFGQMFEIGISGTFNPNIKIPAEIVIDSVTTMSGYMQLLAITKSDKNKIEYSCAVIGRVGNIFQNLSDAKLEDLDLSEYDHAYSLTNVADSWSIQIQKNGSNYAFALGEGYVYPLIDYGFDSTHTIWRVDNMFPAIYVKQLLDKIFKYAGYIYSSTFLTSTFFKRLIIPFNGDFLKLSEAQVIAREFKASNTANQDLGAGATAIVFPDDSTGTNYDPGSNYASNAFTAPSKGVYEFEADILLSIGTGAPPGGTAFVSIADVDVQIIFMKQPLSGPPVVLNTASFYAPGTPTFQGIGYIPQPGSNFTTPVNLKATTTVVLIPGESVYVLMTYGSGKQIYFYTSAKALISSTTTMTRRVNTASYFINRVVNTQVYEGDTITMNDALPQDVPMKDFLINICRMFNLYIQPDASVENKLNIEPRNTFYSTAAPLDWTDKLDLSKPLEIKPMGALDAKTYMFAYSDDDDYYNAIYRENHAENFGTRVWDVQNDFLKNQKKIEVSFAPTPCVNFNNSDRVTPAIYARDSSGVITRKASKLRILYYGGLKTCLTPWTLRMTNPIQIDTPLNTYPYAGMVDDPAAPTLDLSFGVPKEIFWKTLQYTNNHLFNAYYKEFIQEISDKDSKIVVASLYLTVTDINQLDLRQLIYIDGIVYRINKIIDFNPTVTNVTKVELIKAKDQTTFIERLVKVRGGVKNNIETATSA